MKRLILKWLTLRYLHARVRGQTSTTAIVATTTAATSTLAAAITPATTAATATTTDQTFTIFFPVGESRPYWYYYPLPI